MLTSDPKILIFALLAGTIPSIVWLWFWLREDNLDPEPKGLVTIVFILGMLSVLLVIPIQKFIQNVVSDSNWQIICWATIEEVVKYLAVVILLFRNKFLNHPIDWAMFLVTAALGFAAFENAMFLIKPFSLGETTLGLMTSQLRFLGSTLLHAVSSGIIGISLGLSFYASPFIKKFAFIIGLCFAIALHSAFNFFIMSNNGGNVLKVMAFLWVATVINLLLFEKLRRS